MRRGNKSHKVPNVKLRPPPRLVQRDAPSDHCSSDSELPPNASLVDLCPRPFKGFTICATGTIDKPTLFKMAFELGASSTSDFTDRVTHLISSLHGGAKYMCALERKIPIMTPDWITEAHAIWLRGDDVDVKQSTSKHRLPVFSGVVLSLSGIDDVNRRTEINRLVTANQGIYLKNLERPVRVTHLLCSGDMETDKMKYAEKFNHRKEAHIHLVWEEWFWDCLKFGGRFDERKYQVTRPRPERKSLHEASALAPSQAPISGSRPDSALPVDSVEWPKQSKSLLPAGSFTVIDNFPIDDDDEEMAIVNKPVPAVTLQLWQSLLKPRGFELDGGKLVRSPSKSQATRSPPSTPTRTQVGKKSVHRDGAGAELAKEKEKESVLSSFRRAHSFTLAPIKELTVRQPFRRNTACSAVRPCEPEGSNSQDSTHLEGESPPSALFTGYTFRLLGEARCPNVRSAIENGGGVVTDDDAKEPCFIIVRLISGSKLYHDEPDAYMRTKYRTECWLEHSVFHEQLYEPDENISFTPLRIMTPVPDSEKIKLSLSGLDQSELCWIRRLVRAVGITLEPTFSRRSTHLLCPSGVGTKFDKALEWQIPVISVAWLEYIARTGTIPLVDDEFLVGESPAEAADGEENDRECAQHPGLTSQTKREKGKSKEREVDCQMMDITNGESAGQPMFVKNAALLQDAIPRECNTRRHEETSRSRSPHHGLFGEPRYFTHDSDLPEEDEAYGRQFGLSSPPAPPLSSSPPATETELPCPEPTFTAPASPIPSCQPSCSIYEANANLKAKTDAQTNVNVQVHVPTPTRTQVQTHVPSSTTPSPMKLPLSSSLPGAFVPSSPALFPDTDAITKALHESLTSLLGKRPIAEEDHDEAMRDAGIAGGGGGGKKGKRVRPSGPSNITSRNASRESMISPPRPVAICPPVPPADVDMNLLDGLGMVVMRSTEESLRVTYEDPGQAEEKRRLLRMLGDGEDTEVRMTVGRPGVTARGAASRSEEGGRVRRKRPKALGFK